MTSELREFFDKWKDTDFCDSDGENWDWDNEGISPKYSSFQNDYKNILKSLCQKIGYAVDKFNNGCYSFSAVLKNNANERCFDFMIKDVRMPLNPRLPNDWFDYVYISAEVSDDMHNNFPCAYSLALSVLVGNLVMLDKNIDMWQEKLDVINEGKNADDGINNNDLER